jgi:hypothetical protein
VGSSHVRNCDGKDHPDSASARGGLYSCGFPDDHTYETRASKISEDGKRMFRIEKKTPNSKIVYEEMYEKIKEASLDLIDGPAGELNGSKSSGRAVVGARKPAGVNRCISCKCRNLVRIWSASTGVVSLVSRGSLQPSFPTTAVYWHGVLSSRVPEPVIMAWFPDTIRKSGAIGCAPIFVFIDCVPIALVPFAAWK